MANAWSAHVAKIVKGNSGGKGQTSMGSGTDTSKTEEGVDAAIGYLNDLKI